MNDFEEKEIWVIYNNTDKTEGRGVEYPAYYCLNLETAQRLCRGIYVQGTNAPIVKEYAYVDPKRKHHYYAKVYIQHPNDADKIQIELNIKKKNEEERKQKILDKAKALGLTDEEIADLKK